MWTAAVIACGHTLALVVIVRTLRELRFDPTFSSGRDVLMLGAVTFGGTILSSVVSVTALNISGAIHSTRIVEAGGEWWLGDAVGILVFSTPFLCPFRTAHAGLKLTVRKWEGIAAEVLFVAVALFTVGPLALESIRHFPVDILVGLFVLWASVRYGVWTGSVFILMLGVVAVGSVAVGTGPFAQPGESLLGLWSYLLAVEALVLLLAALTAEKNRSAARLADSEQMYRDLVEDNPAMICRLDRYGVVLYANETFLKLSHVDSESVLGRPFLEGAASPDQDNLARTLKELTPGGQASAFEVLAPGGRMRWQKWMIRAVGTEGGPVECYQAIGLDVTEKRRAEDDRRALEEQMFHTQKLESLGVLAGGVAHDFNNILTGVLGHAELAGELVSKGSDVHYHLGRVTDSARRAADLTRQLLAYAGKARMIPGPLDLNAIIRDTAELVAVSIPKKVAVRFEPGRGLPGVEADETQIRQVLMNLIINAGEAIGDQPGTIHVRTDTTDLAGSDLGLFSSAVRQDMAPGRYVRLRVSDNGSGMDEATRARVFDPFFSTKFTGRGLGLAAVQGIVRAHRGAVLVESEPGHGSEFTILLPALNSITRSNHPTPSDFPTMLRRSSGDRPLALIIDDEGAVRAAARAMLEQAGWSVLSTADGRDGVSLFRIRADDVAVVLLDMTMPEPDGPATLAELRRVRPDVPVVLCSGYIDEAEAARERLGAAGALAKPFGTSELRRALSLALAASPGPAAVPAG